jgi:hypothetical protein
MRNGHLIIFKLKINAGGCDYLFVSRITVFLRNIQNGEFVILFIFMKYKRLTTEELKALEPEFVHFLAAAQITGADWDKMKREELSKAEELIEVFSDMVYEKVMSKIRYLEYREKKTLNIFHCTDEQIILVGLRVNEHSPVDLTADDVFAQWNEHATNNAVNIIKTERVYQKERGIEIFELLQSGCYITDDRLFTVLKGMISK